MTSSQHTSVVQSPSRCVICGEQHDTLGCPLVKISEYVFDKEIPPRAKLTLPDFLEVKALSDGTYTVTTKAEILKGTRFGPFQAEKTETLEPSVLLPLKIFNYDEKHNAERYLNTCDENKCSWLMYVSPAECLEEQNLICYQENNEIYYVAIKNIAADEPLKVWYSPYYALKMKKDALPSKNNFEESCRGIDINSLIKKQQKIMERKIWTCKFCSQIENDIVPFARHMLKHYTAHRKNLCEICNKIFGSKKHLKNHVKFIHKVPITTSSSNRPKTAHSANKTNNKDVALGGPLLNDLFTDSSDLQQSDLNQFDLSIDSQNLLLEDNDNLTVDNLLNDNVKDLDHFNFEIDDSQKQFVCDICLKQFNKVRLLIVHMRQHTGDFICRRCLKVFCRKENLKNHICTIGTSHRCIICSKKFMLKKYLLRHLQAVHQKKFRCVSCNKNYHSRKELMEHNCSKIPESDKEKFICSVCDKSFYRDIYLKRHLRTHAAQRKTSSATSCEMCGLILENRNSYYSHKKTHQEPSHCCEICSKKFRRADALREHVQIHADNQIECEFCGRKFKTNKLLKSHLRTHDSVKKTYKCPKCDASVRSRPTLNRHLKKCQETNKNEKNVEHYKCPICLKRIKLKSSILRHIRRLHADVTDVDVNYFKPKTAADMDLSKREKENMENNTDCVSKIHLENNQLEKELAEQIDTLLNNARNNSSIQKHAVDTLVEELDIDGKLKGRYSQDREVCLSIPELTENYQEITLDKNAYILENGTIVQPQGDSDKVVIYVLDQNFSSR